MTGPPIRAYLPGTFAVLATLRRQRELPPGAAYAVTAGLRAEAPGEDDETLEYEAFCRAADASLALLRGGHTAPRRVVIAVDLPAAQVAGAAAADVATVNLAGPVPLTRVAAIHVDGVAAEPAVAAALDAADPSGTELDEELEWYDVSELDQLVPAEAG
ncbi:hypothetical protein JQS43_20410 [Natronosporangium hydrolyticum]|uniref:Uncharacterized protein n=1 Tax=Natronosporangium hydrolyticum TaxID=2811111 RepID=A0A895YID1_9ACTN|nr:hypothetical protein [Natronosporangium hydrolyticum]QSB13890.1 hypothetical protein JQS43_20410 [Natronosporangium hydrolyticum]